MNNDRHWHFTSDGWAMCDLCNRQVKGFTQEITERAIYGHLRERHAIMEFAPSEHEDQKFPYFIPPDRNGLSPLQPKRFDHDANMPAEKHYFGGF